VAVTVISFEATLPVSRIGFPIPILLLFSYLLD